jgi:hypothetical protein
MKTLKQLEREAHNARAVVIEMKDLRNEARLTEIRKFEYAWDLAWDAKHGEQLNALQLIANEASEAVLLARESEALAGIGAKYPLGTVMHEWRQKWSSWARTAPPFVATGKTGVYEAVTRESSFPDGCSTPDVGSFVIRVTKKDGTPGLKCVSRSYEMSNWYPEGVDPNGASK